MKVVGQVEKLFEKNAGSFTYWALQVNNTEYRVGKYSPRGIAVGDWVEFEAASKQNGNYTNWTADYKTLRKSAPGSAGSGPAQESIAQQAPAQRSYQSTGNDERQEIISKQAALNTGFNLFSKLVELGAITPPTAVKKNGLYEFYTAAFHAEAAKCFKLSTGKTWDIDDKPEEAEQDDFSDDLPEGDAW